MERMYLANEKRYQGMIYNRCGQSGLKLPLLSLGLWHNFGACSSFDNMRNMCITAFDEGITHFDLANNYGPYFGSAEENFGRILIQDLRLTGMNSLSAPRLDMICGKVPMEAGGAENISLPVWSRV